MIIFKAALRRLRRVGVGKGVYHYQQLHEGSLLDDVVGVASGGGDFVDIIQEALLLFLI